MVRKSLCILAAWFAVMPLALAANVDLADKPLASGTSGEVKPNVMIVLDDSGSMSWTHLPDHVNGLHDKNGYRSAQCNGVYFNPAASYEPPVKADGTSYPNVDFYKAPYNGFDTGSSKIDLSKSFRAYDSSTCWSPDCGNDTSQAAYYYSYSGTQPAMSYSYKANGDVDTSTTFYKECSGSIAGKFGKVTVEGQGAAARQNFANWYSYYRTRLMTAKTAVGRSLVNISEPANYRIGFTTHSYTGTSSANSEFQRIDDFCAATPGCAQRTQIFNKLYGASPSGGTPLRAALSKVGRIYAGKLGDDPVQYSCQQNFTILTTDGFWNGDAGYKIDGSSSIGNQDGSAARPMWDGASSKQVDTYQRYSYSLSNCSGGKKRIRRQEQRKIVTTPIEPPGSPVDGAWTNHGSATNYTSCTNPAPALPDPNPSDPVLLSSTTTTTGGTSHSLSDVAMYYYQNDLRTPGLGNCTGTTVGGKTYDVCENNVPGAGSDKATHQHMTTFTLGLGIDGSLKYCENYDSGGCADFEAIRQGTSIWPDPMDEEDLHRVDDLWHAAVNGRGKYFSAKSPESLASGIQKALSGVSARTASAAAAATSNLEPVAGDNYAYVAMYTTVDWDGEIAAREIDLAVGTVSDSPIWSAQAQVDAKVSTASDTRDIRFNSGGTLKAFTVGNLGPQITANYFQPGPTNPNGQLSQYASLTAGEQAQATQASIIGFIRGQTQHEDEGSNAWKLYRDRKHALGDIVNAAPVYARKPPFTYSDDNYSTFAENNKTRQSVVYAGANDGMLHAFNGDTGNELWAFVPTAVIPQLYQLADKSYATNHRFHVDGPLTIGDVCLSASCNANQWKTVLVGGLGKGGRAYYALDVTNPASPQLLWEFTDANLGFSFGNAVITKLNGQWVVIVASGYNNVSPGDGKGRLFVLKASDGSKLAEIVTDNAQTDPSKSGIAKISNWVDNTMLDNSTQHVYGGDLDGNVWRFDIVAETVTKITTIGKVGGAPTQPITTKPELAEVKIGGSPKRLILIGAGRYLGTSDVGSTDLMSIYTIKDDLTSPPYGNFRARTDVVVQDFSGDAGSRQIAYTAMAPDKVGWYMDLDAKNGERVNVDPKFQLGWWVVPSNIPDPNVCNIGGSSWLYFLDPWPGRTRPADPATIVNVGNALIVGINIVKLPSGKTVTIVTTSDAKYPVFGNPMAPFAANARRLYWRELTR
ncbi:MAG: PilC/PilY family type IV pilus protein [Burkholderiaceae bacterium]|nr:PilC/PilY family type IV pilus protein [Burkholderiaceae bacterium]